MDSSVGLKGTIKHLGMMTFVMMFLPALSIYMGTKSLKVAIITYIVYQYSISIMENLHLLGFDLPDWIVESLRRLHDDELNKVKGMGLDDKETKNPQ